MKCSDEVTTILAMLQVQNVFLRPSSGQESSKARTRHRLFQVEEGDLLTLLNVYTNYQKNKNSSWCQKNFLNYNALRRATEIRSQMRKLLRELEIPVISCEGK